MSRHLTRAATALLTLSSVATAQTPEPGFRIFGPHGTTQTFMVDTSGTVVHTWPSSFPPGNGLYLEADGTLIRSLQIPGAPGIGGRGGGIQRIAFDGTQLWDFRYTGTQHWGHHDIEPLPNGNVLMIAWELMTTADAIAAGRNPALITGTAWLPDTVVEIQQTGPTTGTVVWEWRMMDHVIQDFDGSKANFGTVANNPGKLDINFPPTATSNGDWNHANSVDYDPVNDIILLNCPFQDEFYLIDHSTTTAEAAGSIGGNFGVGGDFVYRWGNPLVYRAGTAGDQKLFNQHGTHIIPAGLSGAGNVLLFNNQAGGNFSTVGEIELPASFTPPPAGQAWGPSAFTWDYVAAPPTALFSSGLSNVERLPGGNTLICSGRQNGWIFEITPTKQKVWEFFNTVPNPSALVFQVSYYERYLWADRETVSSGAGETVDFDMVAGTKYAGDTYLLLGTATGTNPGFTIFGVDVPLNPDVYFSITAGLAGTAVLPTWLGTLDGLGKASASFPLPVEPALVGLVLHHAYLVVEAGTGLITFASNAVPLTFGV